MHSDWLFAHGWRLTKLQLVRMRRANVMGHGASHQRRKRNVLITPAFFSFHFATSEFEKLHIMHSFE